MQNSLKKPSIYLFSPYKVLSVAYTCLTSMYFYWLSKPSIF
ncbi:hypothetical protein M23134_06294 [Microscilla marina ATCC 23134]|uniref:Uncharacterized protein n=1 Tax=Microscilla marina ATCC 23134 TaxID=313606 RepID=A1ZYU3_MICM2|nr:hypothetical protein M23134_06294 [Microscilla marina ATCC 23134]